MKRFKPGKPELRRNHEPDYTILLVDDSDVDCATYRRLLQQTMFPGSACQLNSCQFFEVATGEEALAYCQQGMPDVILLDYSLPDMSGLQVLQALKQQQGQEKLPVIVMTGQSSTEAAVVVLKGGALDYLDKSQMGAENLHRAVTAVIQQMQLTQALQRQQQQQQLLTHTALQIRQSLTLDDVLQTTVYGVQDILNCDRVVIYQFQPDWSGMIVVEAVIDPACSILGKVATDNCFSSELIAAYCQGRTHAIDDIHTANLSKCHAEFLASLQVQANLIVPILLGNHLWGLLVSHECQSPRHWQADDIELLVQLATQVSIAIQQAALVNQLQTELQDRRAAETALQMSEERFRAIFEAEPECVKVISVEGVLQTMNPAGLAIIEADSQEDVIGQNICPLIVPEQQQTFLEFIQQANQEKTCKLEFEIIGLKGTRRWLESHAVPLHVPGNTTPHVLAVTRDITDRKQIEKSLRESEEKLRLLIQYAPASISMFDHEMRYIMASQRWIDDYHLDGIATLVGRSHYEVFPEISDRWKQVHQRCLAGAIEKCDEELFVRADGFQQWIRWEIHPWYRSMGNIGGIVVFSEDITQRKRDELELEKFQFLVEHASDMVVLFSTNCKFHYVNQAFCQAVGYTHTELLAMEACDIYVDGSSETFQMVLQAAQQGKLTIEIQHRTKSGRIFDAEVSMTYFTFAEQAYLCAFARDITDRKQIETLLRESEEKLRLLIRYSPASIAMFDHEMRYIMTSQRWVDEHGARSIEVCLGKSHYDIYPDIPERWRRMHQRCLAGAIEKCEEDVYVREGQAPQWVRWETHPWYKADSQVGGIIIFSENITSRKQADLALQQLNEDLEQRVAERTNELVQVNDRLQQELFERERVERALRTSEARFRSAFEDAAIGIALVAPNGRFLRGNPALCQFLGYTQTELKEITFQAITHPDDLKADLAYLQQVLMNEIQTYQMQKRYFHKNGHAVWGLLSGSLVRNEQGKPLYFISQIQDISEIKRLEAERKQAEASLAQLAAIVESSEDAIVGKSLDGLILSWNAAAERMFGYTTDEVIGKSISMLFPPAHLDDMQYVLQRIREGEVVDHYETVRQCKDGNLINISITVSPIRDAMGRIVAASAIKRDITAQKQMQQTLELQSVIMNNMAGGVCMVRASDWTIVYVNPKFAALFGYEVNELEDCPVNILNYDDSSQTAEQSTIEIIHQIETYGEASYEVHNVKKDGTSFWCLAHTTLFNHPNYGKVYVAVQDDITDRKQAEASLCESDRRWRSLLDNVQLIVVGLDRNGNVEYANPFFLKLTGFIQEEVVGKNWMQTFIPVSQRTRLQSTFQELLEQNFYPHYQNSILTKSGEERMITWSNTLLQDMEGRVIGTISIGEDITERYKLERMKAEFISVVSHELRTPLTSMQAALSLLAENIIDPTTSEGRDVIHIAAGGVDRLVRLVNDILDLERLESGKIHLEKRCCNTADLMTIAIEQMQEMANQAGVMLKSTPQMFQIYADGDRILQVLINLLSNAIKFSSNGDTVMLDVAVIEMPPAGLPYASTLLFTIQDQGRGIPADKLESIFERFHQVDGSDSREKGGTGLGLAICRSIVQQHNGKIWAESILEQGSTFYFTLPMDNKNHDI